MTELRLGSLASRLVIVVAAVWLAEQVIPLLQGFGDILLVFFLAWLVAFVLEPVVTLLERMRLPHGLAVSLIYLILLLGVVLLVVVVGPLVLEQLGALQDDLPDLVAQLPTGEDLAGLLARTGLPADIIASYHPDTLIAQAQSSAGDVMQRLIDVATSAATIVVNLALILIISFYLLLDGRSAIRSALRLVPEDRRHDVMLVLGQVSANFGGFLRGQVIQAVLFGLAVALVMLALGMSFVAVTALASAVLMLMPLIGPALALLPPLAVALFSPQNIVIVTLVVLFVVQAAIVNVLMPRVLSGQMGLPPLLVFAAILFGLRIGGALGAFFGIPIMGVIYGVVSALTTRWRQQEAAGRRSPQVEHEAMRTNS